MSHINNVKEYWIVCVFHGNVLIYSQVHDAKSQACQDERSMAQELCRVQLQTAI